MALEFTDANFQQTVLGKVSIGKVNVDNNPEISQKYGVRNIPTILFIKGGEVVDKKVGAVPKHLLNKMIQEKM